jgi:hypothetical protein
MLKPILTQAIAMAVVWGINALVSRWVDPSLWWGVVAAWILIDDVGVYQDLKLMTKRHDDLVCRLNELDKDYKQCLNHKDKYLRSLTKIVLENSSLLAEVRKSMKSPSSSSSSSSRTPDTIKPTRILHMKACNRLAGHSCVW